mgnify:CR=1 FL=1
MYYSDDYVLSPHEVEDWKFIQEKALNFCRQQVLKKAHGKIGTILDNGEFEIAYYQLINHYDNPRSIQVEFDYQNKQLEYFLFLFLLGKLLQDFDNI